MRVLILLIMVACSSVGTYILGIETGKHVVKAAMPSCLYVERPRNNDIRPWGFDNKPGIDVLAQHIQGGGLYISLDKWKR